MSPPCKATPHRPHQGWHSPGLGFVALPSGEKKPVRHKTHVVLPAQPGKHMEQADTLVCKPPGTVVVPFGHRAQSIEGSMFPSLQVPFGQRVQPAPPNPAGHTAGALVMHWYLR